MIKGLKIFDGVNVLKKINKKLKRGKLFLVAGTLAFSLLSTGCGRNNESKYDYSHILTSNRVENDIDVETETSIETESISNNSSKDLKPSITYNQNKPILEGTFEGNIIKVDSSTTKDFYHYLEKINVDYDYSDIFYVEEALEKYEDGKYQGDINEHTYDLLDGKSKVDTNKLYKLVKDNNDKHLKKVGKTSLYEKLSDKELKIVCEIIADTINKYIDSNKDIDLDEISCNLGGLKVFNKMTMLNAYVSTDGCLVISPTMIDILQKSNKNIDVYRNTIMHETVHLLQRSCDDVEREYPGKQGGIGYKFEDLDVNPLYFNWLLEGSAEKCVINQTGDDALVYETMISYIQSLNFVSVLKNDVKVNQTEELSLSRNLEKLFEQFGCKTYEDKVELINMMMAIEIIQSEPEDFTRKYEKVYGKTLDVNEYSMVKCKIKPQAMMTLSKYFYSNLMRAIENKQIALEDLFYLISTFEQDINGHIKYTNNYYDEYNKEFLEEYIKLQNEFFYTISINSSYSDDEIIGMFNEYNKNIITNDKVCANYSLNWLDKDKKEFIDELSADLSCYDDESIRFVYEKMNKKVLTR